MTTPSHRPRPHGPRSGGHGEQPTQPLRPLPGQQPYDQPRSYAQQPSRGAHSGGRHEAPRPPSGDRTAVVTGITAVLALLLAGAGVLVLTKDDTRNATGADPTSRAPSAQRAPTTVDTPAAAGRPADAAVGDCIKVNKASATDADIETADCADTLAVYRVGVREEGAAGRCPNENYVSYTEDGLLLCLMLNARPGECFNETDRQDSRVPCGSPRASYKVGNIFDGTDDANQCGEADARNALTYPEPPLTICRLNIG